MGSRPLIRWLVLAVAVSVCPATAAIETWPALYNVYDVASGDVLNVRTHPNASSEVIANLAPNATNIEVIDVDEDHLWGLINTPEGSGWVSLRFMEKHPRWVGSFPPITTCLGTEPFWSMTRTSSQTKLDYFDEVLETAPTTDGFVSQNRYDHFGLIIGESHAFITEGMCSDGMSDNLYGLTIEIFTHVEGNPAFLAGCCSITPH